MSQVKRCPECDGVLGQNGGLGGRCPRCMLALGFEPVLADNGDSEPTAPMFDNDRGPAAHPAAIGRYRILRLIDEGGMGIVYEAQQDKPRRTVALKIIKPGMANPESLRRFEQESQALGRLQHPGIAQIYEAGTVDTGFGPQPYLAMELIRGHSPRDHAEMHSLNTRQRLEMMVKICDAVHHAHQRGLIHRDLKPGNILVDETGQPKILDFGVARLTDSDARVTQTKHGQLVGTPAYMSPEQTLADPLDIDTRTDIYALGVILYELLTGRMPYTISKKLHETIQAIQEEDPVRLSTLNRAYRGDIETIVGKALEKDRTRRYAAAAGMALDIQRFLDDEPIAARPPSTSYQLRKFAQRNRALVAGAAAVFAVLVVAVIALSVERTSRQISDSKLASTVEFATTLLREGIDSPDVEQKLSVGGISAMFGDDRLQEATAQELLAERDIRRGNLSDGRARLERAVALRRGQRPAHPDTIKTTLRLAEVFIQLERFSKAEEVLRTAILDARTATDEVEPLQSAVSLLAGLYTIDTNEDRVSRFSQVERFLKEEVIDYRRQLPVQETDSVLMFAISELLALYTNYNPPKYAEAAVFIKDIARIRGLQLREGHPVTLDAEKQLISLYLISQPQPLYAEAEAYLKPRVEARRRNPGDRDPATQTTINYLVSMYLSGPQPNYTAAKELLEDVLKEARYNLGIEKPATRNASIGLAKLYFKKGGSDSEAANLLTPIATTAANVTEALAQPNALEKQAMAQPRVLKRQPATLDDLDRSSRIYGTRGNPLMAANMEHLTQLEDPTILDVLDLLVRIHDKQGNQTLAQAQATKLRTILEAGLRSARESGGEDLVILLKSVGSIVLETIGRDNHRQVDRMLGMIVEDYRKLAEKGAKEEVATLLTSAAITYSRHGEHRQAEELLKSVLNIDLATMGEKHWHTQRSMWRLATWFMERSMYREGRDMYVQLNRIQTKSYGPEHATTRTTTADIQAVYQARIEIESRQGNQDQVQLLRQLTP